jgi:hypothetical protein
VDRGIAHNVGSASAPTPQYPDPVTGSEAVVFSCANPDQVDFAAIHDRLAQNGAQEILTKLWIDHCPAPPRRTRRLAAESL